MTLEMKMDLKYEEGLAMGIEQGIERGIEQGKYSRDMQIISTMLEKGMDKQTIAEVLNETVDYVESMQQ